MGHTSKAGLRSLLLLLVLVGLSIAQVSPQALAGESEAPDLGKCHELFLTGSYRECATAAAAAIDRDVRDESWRVLQVRSELAVGEYARAKEAVGAGLVEYPTSIRLRWFGREAYLFSGDAERADELVEEIEIQVRRAAWRYRDPENRMIVGRYFLQRGTDARSVLEAIYDPVKKEAPDFAGAYVASGELALAKHDYAVAAEEFERARKATPDDSDDPVVRLGLARALAESDAAAAQTHLEAALERNPRHVESLLYLLDGTVDRESYDEAAKLVQGILEIHPGQPAALAYRAVLAHVAGDFTGEKAARDAALAGWTTNPEVDHLIGQKLSQKYRFEEGATYQRRALTFDPSYLPAKLQLCQDLLRLGREAEGWKLAQEVYEEDGYNVVAHNLNVLHDHLRGFRVLEDDGLVVRMDAREAAIYGPDVMELLREAKATLCPQYEVKLAEPIVVEIFPEQKDFAIRTFGLPGGAGFLGVCFGNVITANSPASQGESPSNWRAMLWHEFCHVVTLHKSRNRMPRWLSEGISVYEEGRRNRAWGESMTPTYLELIEKEGLTPVSELSGSFLQPRTPLHLQFAYYQSSLVVEFLVARHGPETLAAMLSDLSKGLPINKVLESRTGSLDALDVDVEAFIRSRAEELSSKARWERPEDGIQSDPEALASWIRDHPGNFWGLQLDALRLMSQERWQEAKASIQKLLELVPEYVGPGNGYELLAKVYRELSETDAERRMLEKLTTIDAAAAPACLRLLELCESAKDWRGALVAAERLLATNPLLKAAHRAIVSAAEATGSVERAARAYRALLVMDPIDPAELHFGLARVLREEGKLDEAKRELLAAVEEAPRFRKAHRELLEVVRKMAERSAPQSDATEADTSGPVETERKEAES